MKEISRRKPCLKNRIELRIEQAIAYPAQIPTAYQAERCRANKRLSLTAPLFTLAVLGSQSPNQSDKNTIALDYQEVMIRMRDGVRLQTVIISPKDAKIPLPILLRRTPYGVPEKKWFDKGAPAGSGADKRVGVVQNLRGRFKSEGKFVMQRPPHPPTDLKGVDETTDAWDTVEWLIHNVLNNNGRVGLHGTSYDAWTAVMASLNPHPRCEGRDRAGVPCRHVPR